MVTGISVLDPEFDYLGGSWPSSFKDEKILIRRHKGIGFISGVMVRWLVHWNFSHWS